MLKPSPRSLSKLITRHQLVRLLLGIIFLSQLVTFSGSLLSPAPFPIPCLQEFASFLFVLPTTREPDDRLGSLPLKTDLLQKYLITCGRSFQPCSATIFTAFITNSTESSDIKYGKLSRTKPGLGRTCELIFTRVLYSS